MAGDRAVFVRAFTCAVAIAAMAPPAMAQLQQDIRVSVVQLLLPLPRDAAADEIARSKADAQRIIDQVRQCEDLRSIAQRTPGATVKAVDWLRLGDLPPSVAQPMMAVSIGHAVGPYAVVGAIQILAICSRVQGPPEPPQPPRQPRRRPSADNKE